jgi:uncharacterized protein YbcC (UPF0753/DUF2309 family)
MANDPRVRAELERRGIAIPATTWLIGGHHDTCADAVTFTDLDRVPEALRQALRRLLDAFEQARRDDAGERCRRFARAADVEPARALRHAAVRSTDIKEPRPEYGHGTNAMLIVGRRELTRGLYLDRRPFLQSYDPASDPQGQILTKLLSAVIPVCAGISLEYYFSTVDNERYGCGTKLPHNLVGLVGVTAGGGGDLRTGLPLQTVEIHEPMRLLVLVEVAPEIGLRALDALPAVRQLVHNDWILLHFLDPQSGEVTRPTAGGLVPSTPPVRALPRARSSLAYARGRSEHLVPAVLEEGT